MKKKLLVLILILAFCGTGIRYLNGVIMKPKDHICPICLEINSFVDIMSCGSYVYKKFPLQTINWPLDENSFLFYICKKCNYSAFGGDFTELSEDQITKVENVLQTCGYPKIRFEEYNEVPVSKRLEIAEICYKAYKTDDDFWCFFYRVMACHYQLEHKTEKEKNTRLKALSYLKKISTDPAQQGMKKKILLWSGAMKYWLNDVEGALRDFKAALGHPIRSPGVSNEYNKEIDDYYSKYLLHFAGVVLEPYKKSNRVKWFYEMGTFYTLYYARLDSKGIIYALALWLVIASLFLMFNSAIERVRTNDDAPGDGVGLWFSFLVILVASASYAIIYSLPLSETTVLTQSVLTGLIWLGMFWLTRFIARKKSGKYTFIGRKAAHLTRLKRTKSISFTLILVPVLVGMAFVIVKMPVYARYRWRMFETMFQETFQTGLMILFFNFSAWLFTVAFFLLITRLFKSAKVCAASSYFRYLYSLIGIGWVILVAEVYFRILTDPPLPYQAFLLIGGMWLFLDIIFSLAVIGKRGGRNWKSGYRQLLRMPYWYLVRAAMLAAPFLLGICRYWDRL